MSLFKKLVAGLTATVLALSITACSGDTTWAMKNENTTITSGLYLFYLTQSTMEAEQKVQLAEKESIFDKTIDDKSTSDWIKEQAKIAAAEHMVIDSKFVELGLELTAEDQASIDQQVAYYYPSFDQYYGFTKKGIGEDSYRLSVENNIKYSKIFNKYYGKDGLEAVSEQDLKTFFQDKYAKTKMITLNKTDASYQPLAEEALTVLKTNADGYITRINGGETIDVIDKEYKAVVAAQTATPENPPSTEEPAPLEYSFIYKESSNMGESIKTALFDTAKIGGEAILAEDENAYYIIQKYDHMSDPADFTKYSETVLQYMKSDELKERVAQWATEIKYDTNNGSIKRYDPKKTFNLVSSSAAATK